MPDFPDCEAALPPISEAFDEMLHLREIPRPSAYDIKSSNLWLREHLQEAFSAAIGERTLFELCPDCNGMGSIYTMDSTPMLNEYEQECIRCQEYQGLVKVWPKT